MLDLGHIGADLTHRLDGLIGLGHGLLYELSDLLRALRTVDGELADFVCDHGKALAMLTGSCSLNSRIERKQIGLVGDLLDDLGDLVNFLGIGRNAGDHLDHALHLGHAVADDGDRVT